MPMTVSCNTYDCLVIHITALWNTSLASLYYNAYYWVVIYMHCGEIGYRGRMVWQGHDDYGQCRLHESTRSMQFEVTGMIWCCQVGGKKRRQRAGKQKRGGWKYQRKIQAREVHKNAVMLAHVDCSYIGVIDKLAWSTCAWHAALRVPPVWNVLIVYGMLLSACLPIIAVVQ